MNTNERLDKARKLLFANNYRRIREHLISQKDIDRTPMLLEWWAGGKGVVLLQSEEGLDYVSTFLDWGHGVTWEEFATAIRVDDPPNEESSVWTAKPKECAHDWKTTRSYGATVGYDAKCTKCGEETTFTPSDD